MKPNFIKYSFAALAFIALASCATRKEMAVYSTDPNAIQFDIQINSGEDFALRDEVNISCESGNIPYTKVPSGWKPSGNAYFRWGPRTHELTFSAIYPAVANASYARFYVPKNQSTVPNFASANYSRGEVKNPECGPDGKIVIDVERIMSKVKFNIKGLAEGERIQAFKVGSFNGLTDTTVVDRTACEVSPLCIVPDGGVKGGNGCSYEAYVCPGNSSSLVILFSYSYGGVTYSKKGFPKRTSGATYEYDLTITPTGYSISDPVVHQ